MEKKNVVLRPDQVRAIEALAADQDRSFANMVRQLMDQALAHHPKEAAGGKATR